MSTSCSCRISNLRSGSSSSSSSTGSSSSSSSGSGTPVSFPMCPPSRCGWFAATQSMMAFLPSR